MTFPILSLFYSCKYSISQITPRSNNRNFYLWLFISTILRTVQKKADIKTCCKHIIGRTYSRFLFYQQKISAMEHNRQTDSQPAVGLPGTMTFRTGRFTASTDFVCRNHTSTQLPFRRSSKHQTMPFPHFPYEVCPFLLNVGRICDILIAYKSCI